MREERGPAQALTYASAPADRSSLRSFRNSNRHNSELETSVTHSKQRAATLSNRHKYGGILFKSAYPQFGWLGGILLTPAPRLVYISRVLEETVSLCPASNSTYRRGARFVGAGIGHGFEDSSYTFVQMLFMNCTAGVSLPGTFALADRSARTACPDKWEEA
jgi:hypothetical protein